MSLKYLQSFSSKQSHEITRVVTHQHVGFPRVGWAKGGWLSALTAAEAPHFVSIDQGYQAEKIKIVKISLSN
jgi:hypothetical protein